MQFVIVLLVLAFLVVFVTVPLRRQQRGHGRAAAKRAMNAAHAVEDLEAAREAKYREIRDAELDHSTGKLSEPDFRALDRSLRAEAIEILRALDRARERAAEGGAASVQAAAGSRVQADDSTRAGERLPSTRR